MDKESETNHKRFIGEYLELYALFLKEATEGGKRVYMTDGDYVALFRGYLAAYDAATNPGRVQHQVVLGAPNDNVE